MQPLLFRVLIAGSLWTIAWIWLARRRRFRFGLSAVMVLVAGYALALGMATESLRIEGRPLKFRGFGWYLQRSSKLETAIAAIRADSPTAAISFDSEHGVLFAVGVGTVSRKALDALGEASLVHAAVIECESRDPGVPSKTELQLPEKTARLAEDFEAVSLLSEPGPLGKRKCLRLFRHKPEMHGLWSWITSPAAPFRVTPQNP